MRCGDWPVTVRICGIYSVVQIMEEGTASEATKRKPDFKMHKLDATGTVSKYLILRALTFSFS